MRADPRRGANGHKVGPPLESGDAVLDLDDAKPATFRRRLGKRPK